MRPFAEEYPTLPRTLREGLLANEVGHSGRRSKLAAAGRSSSFLVTGIVSLCGCSLIVGTETPVVRDSGTADSSSDAAVCSYAASTCRKACSNTESTCESGCDNQPNKDACRSTCQSTGQTCSQTCTSTCTACVTTNGCSSASRCSSN